MKAAASRLLKLCVLLGYCVTFANTAPQASAPEAKSNQANKSTLRSQAFSSDEISELLGWKADPKNFCLGYYLEPDLVKNHPNPSAIDQNTTAITADGPTTFVKDGRSILQKNVTVSQPGRLIKADKAYIYRDGKKGRITAIELTGHVRLWEKDKLIVSKRVMVHLDSGEVELDHNLYHLYYAGSYQRHFNAWGTATQATRPKPGIIDLKGQATYTTCPPIKPSWQIKASSIHLDRNKGVGSARNITLRFKNIPFFYSPYYSFPLDHRRKSGILAPTIGYSGDTGWDVSLPIYWNMAANYDATITPRVISKRGYQINALTRLLTNNSRMRLFANYLPGDKLFADFKNQVLQTYPLYGNNAPALDTQYFHSVQSNTPYINAILGSSNNRWLASFQDHTDFSANWQANVNLNHVSDDYYLSDFDISANGVIANQLINQADLQYQGSHWNFFGLMQGYQTLHPINQAASQDQYQRLPELDATGHYPGVASRFDINLPISLVNFGYVSDFQPGLPIGQRLHLRPSMSYPINWSSGYLTPALYIDNTDYITAHPLPGQKHGLARTLPIFDIHTGAYFDRPLNFGKHHFIQTLEPELLYLFVPYTNQDDAPTYDTYLLPFSFNQLFTVNRFTGFDRLQNANQVSLGLTSRVISSIDGSDKLRLNLGTIYYMTRPKVCLTPGCTPTTNHLSPVVGEATFYPAPHWSASTNWAWDPNVSNTNNANFNLSYSRDSSHLISAGYNFVNTENSPQYSNFNAGFFWPLTHHWSAMGYTYYNLTEHHPDSYYYGLQYNSCCWSLRFVSERDYLGANIGASGNQYKTAYYVQLALNGLGAIGNKNTDDLLLNTLPGYNPQLR